MLGWSPAAAHVRGVAAAPLAAGAAAAAASPVARDERAELLARAAGGFRTLLTREEQRIHGLLSAVAATPAGAAATMRPTAPSTPAPTALPTPPTTLPTSTLFPPSPPPVRTTLLGLPSQPVDVRTATVEEIAAIPAIGPERAAQLVAARGTHPLESVDDVVQLLGLTGVDRVRAHPYLRF
jgi:hypothetical protein